MSQENQGIRKSLPSILWWVVLFARAFEHSLQCCACCGDFAFILAYGCIGNFDPAAIGVICGRP